MTANDAAGMARLAGPVRFDLAIVWEILHGVCIADPNILHPLHRPPCSAASSIVWPCSMAWSPSTGNMQRSGPYAETIRSCSRRQNSLDVVRRRHGRSFLSVFLAASTAHQTRLQWGEECSAVSCQSLGLKQQIISSFSTSFIRSPSKDLLALVEFVYTICK